MEEPKIKVVHIKAESKKEVVEQLFETIKEEMEFKSDISLKDLLYNSIIESMPVERIMSLMQAEIMKQKISEDPDSIGFGDILGLLRSLRNDK